MYSRLTSEVVRQVLTCSVCGKATSSMSQLVSHLHTGSDCLAGYFSANLMSLDTDLGVDLVPALLAGVTRDTRVVVTCHVCGEACLGVISYMLHVDHHRLDVALELSLIHI